MESILKIASQEEGKKPSVNDGDAKARIEADEPLIYHSLQAIDSLILRVTELIVPAKMRLSNIEAKQTQNDLKRAMRKHLAVVNAKEGGVLDKKKSGINVTHLF